jgi:hypothetical protein
MANFIQIDTKDSGPVMINADLILMVEGIRAGHCRVDFGGARFFDVDGPAADKIVEHVKNAMTFQIVGDIKPPKFA